MGGWEGRPGRDTGGPGRDAGQGTRAQGAKGTPHSSRAPALLQARSQVLDTGRGRQETPLRKLHFVHTLWPQMRTSKQRTNRR